MNIFTIAVAIGLSGLSGLISIVLAQQPAAPVPYHIEPYSKPHPEIFRGDVGPQAQIRSATSETVRVEGASWIRIRFRNYNLGEQSYIKLTSLLDGGTQQLDGRTLAVWGHMTAFFNGDAVKIELNVAPEEKGIYYSIEDIMAGEQVGTQSTGDPSLQEADSPGTQEICGSTDDRVRATDNAVGRVMPNGCTGWMVSNGANLTAGHCQGVNQILEFNVPNSLNNGTPVNSLPQDQYPILNYTAFSNGGEGNDWAVFRTGPNANGQFAIQQQNNTFYRMSRDLNPAVVRETGYGIDGPSPLFGDGPRNADSQTLQTHSGPFSSETVTSPSSAVIRYEIDDENGNSGSPVIDTSNNIAIGIGTHAGCNSTGGSNAGTGFENDNLEAALRDFSGVGANVRHLDNGHVVSQVLQDGTVLRPFDTLAEAVNAVPAGGVVSIVTGTYDGSLTISKPMSLRAPVGTVKLTGGP